MEILCFPLMFIYLEKLEILLTMAVLFVSLKNAVMYKKIIIQLTKNFNS